MLQLQWSLATQHGMSQFLSSTFLYGNDDMSGMQDWNNDPYATDT